jgi:hypothetical protein
MEELVQQLQDKEKYIQTIKEKTKLFIDKLRTDHAAVLEQEREQTKAANVSKL